MASRAALVVLLLSGVTAYAAPEWLPLGAQASVVTTGLGQASAGGELSLFITTPGPALTNHDDGSLAGWRIQPGLQVGGAGIGGAYCGEPSFCATRVSLGPTLRIGWLRGFPIGASGAFAQVDVLAARASAKSAPLSPAIAQTELVTRLRLGGQWAPLTQHHDGWTFFLSVVLEAAPLRGVTQGVGVGLSLGVGL